MPSSSIGPAATSRRSLRLATSALVALLLAAPGCGGGVQFKGENRDLIISLATAVSVRDPKLLDENAALIEKLHNEGTCSDAECDALRDIVAKAKAGDWEAAETSVYALRDAQEPNAEDLKNLAERKLSHEPRTLGPTGKPAKKS